MDTLFSLVIMAERALGREMEFNAEKVAEMDQISPLEAVIKRFSREVYSSEYATAFSSRTALYRRLHGC